MPDPTPDPATAALAEIRHRSARVYAGIASGYEVVECADDTPLLLAAVEAVLAKAAEWSVESAGLEGGHRGLADHGADKLRTAMYARSVALKDCETQLREAITRELTKGESGDGLA